MYYDEESQRENKSPPRGKGNHWKESLTIGTELVLTEKYKILVFLPF